MSRAVGRRVDGAPLSASRGRRLRRRLYALGALCEITSNVFTAALLFILFVWVLPTPPGSEEVIVPLLIGVSIYIAVALALGMWLGIRRIRRRLHWLSEERQPTDDERWWAIGLPFALARLTMAFWIGGAVLAGGASSFSHILLGVTVVIGTIIAGFAASAGVYLTLVRLMRPVIALALAEAPLDQRRGTGVAWRTTLTWIVGTGLPLAGLTLLGGLSLGLDVTITELAVTTLVLGSIALLNGLALTIITARGIAHPLRTLRDAMADLASGSHATVPVTDAGEIGVLQTGFNQMARGLAERDRIRDLFGRHVGQDVATKALEEGVQLGGEVRDAAVLFIDVTGSTSMAEASDPEQVVERLNQVFGIVVEEVERSGGTVTTYAGDAVVAVWGAPGSDPDRHTSALTTARAVQRRLADERAVGAGTGVAAGPVLAGNIGATTRLEYTVIGDAVNTAARLSDLSKLTGGRTDAIDHPVLATEDLVSLASPEEATCWTAAGEHVLRGRSTATPLVRPVGSAPAGRPGADEATAPVSTSQGSPASGTPASGTTDTTDTTVSSAQL